MSVKIYSVTLGMDHCYILQDRGTIMIDGGFPGTVRAFKESLVNLSIKATEIGLVILTHGHFDHIGSASKIRELTGANLAMHRYDIQQLENNKMTWPLGVTTWGRVSRAIFKPVLSLLRFEIPQIDVTLNDEGLSLEKYGISGRIIHTPGHSPGSVSVLLSTGDAFVGCLAQNSLPFCLKPSLPIYALNLEQVKKSWRELIDKGATTIYPAHGRPFSIDAINKLL